MYQFTSIQQALARPWSRLFRLSYDGESYQAGDEASFYRSCPVDPHLTFDISNNKVLVNVAANGALAQVVMFRGCYRADYAPGIWAFKDFSISGPYSFGLKLDGTCHDLAGEGRPFETGLLDGIFPITVRRHGDLRATSLVFAPISADGAERPRCAIYGLLLENVGRVRIAGRAVLPAVHEPGKFRSMYAGANVHGYVCPADQATRDPEVPFDLAPGESVWVPAVISAPGEEVVDEIDARGSLDWLNATWTYFRTMLGRLSMPQDPFAEEFFTRAVCQCMENPGMTGTGEVVGATNGTYPTTPAIWVKDFQYTVMPLAWLEPALYRRCLEWLLAYSVRHRSNRYAGGVGHSLSNSLSPIVAAGLYYEATGDGEYFRAHPEVVARMKALLQDALDLRPDPDVWLFTSRYISDGPAGGDYHTGSNMVAWYAFRGLARILAEVTDEQATAAEYEAIAGRIQAAIEQRNVIDGPFGRQYIEGTNRDGSVPRMEHEGEESDTTLLPIYGYAAYDSPVYKNYTHFAASPHNTAYNPATRCISWGIPATFPGYVTAFANVVDAASMSGPEGYLTEIRRHTDVDGSIWWWPYAAGHTYGDVHRKAADPDYPGKCGWGSGVWTMLFAGEILGLRYDAPARRLSFRPFSPSGDFRWDDFRLGAGHFSVACARKAGEITIQAANHNAYGVTLALEVPLGNDFEFHRVLVGDEPAQAEAGRFLDRPTVRLERHLAPGQEVRVTVL